MEKLDKSHLREAVAAASDRSTCKTCDYFSPREDLKQVSGAGDAAVITVPGECRWKPPAVHFIPVAQATGRLLKPNQPEVVHDMSMRMHNPLVHPDHFCGQHPENLIAQAEDRMQAAAEVAAEVLPALLARLQQGGGLTH